VSRNHKRDYANPRCAGCNKHVGRISEYAYMVHDKVWRAALRRARRSSDKVSTHDFLCIMCLEERLGRLIDHDDFDWNNSLNSHQAYKRSKRLRWLMATQSQRMGLIAIELEAQNKRRDEHRDTH